MSQNQPQQQFRNVTYLSDRSGTGKWRVIWPNQSIDCVSQGTGIQSDYSQTPILESNFYNGVNSVTVQRWISPQQREIFQKLLKPMSERNRSWLIYEEDDLMDANQIPQYNRGRKAFEPKEIQDNIRYMLNNSDFVTVTTDYIRKCYNRYYDVPLEKIIAIPNLLPKYLFGDRYHPDRKLEQFKKFKSRPRIGIVSSLSHYNIDNVRKDTEGKACRLETAIDPNTNKPILGNDGKEVMRWMNQDGKEIPEEQTSPILDDFDVVCDCVRSTVNDFQWVMFGFCPPKIEDLAKTGKIEVHAGTQIMNYPATFDNLALQAVVAPIIDMEFNRCKSFIKYMECAVLGVPLFASDSLPYNAVMPSEHLFSDGNELKEKLMKLKFASNGVYAKMIERQWKWFNTPCREGDFWLKNFWLEDNLNIYIDKYRMRPKCNDCSMSAYFRIKKEQEEKKRQNTIFSNDNGVEILK